MLKLKPQYFGHHMRTAASLEKALMERAGGTHGLSRSKHWSFSFNISPSNEHSGLISFGMDWLDLLAVQGTLKSLL